MIIKFEEKWNDRYVGGDTLADILCYVFRRRLADDWYFGCKMLEEVDQSSEQSIVDFMTSRRSYEYEYWGAISVDYVETR